MILPEKGKYDSTISESKETSIARAMEIMMQEIENQQRKPVLTRPEVSVLKGLIPAILLISSFVFLIVRIDIIGAFIPVSHTVLRIILSAIYVSIIILLMKPFLIWLILIYQRYAPEKVRMACYFEPTCSEYMKLAIEKYGVIKGVSKGIIRLGRCHWPNGGEDYP